METDEFNLIGNYWERGNKNENDIVAINDLEKRIVIAEVKLNLDKAKMSLREHRDGAIEKIFEVKFNFPAYIAYSGEKGHPFLFYPDSKIGKKNPQNHNA